MLGIVLADGPTHMARDAALLERAHRTGRGGWRLYRWDGPWVSLGRSQSPETALLPGASVPWVQRPTGGRAVLHGHDLTVGLSVPLAALAARTGTEGWDPRSVRRVYRAVIRPLVEALRAAGADVALAEETPFAGRGGRGFDCFAHVSPNDVVDRRTGVKACGCALRLTDRAVLVQASIPVGPPLVDPRSVFADGREVVPVSLDEERLPLVLAESLADLAEPACE